MDETDLRGATIDPSLSTTASLTSTRIDIEQALPGPRPAGHSWTAANA